MPKLLGIATVEEFQTEFGGSKGFTGVFRGGFTEVSEVCLQKISEGC